MPTLRLVCRQQIGDTRARRLTPWGAPHVSEHPATDRGPKLVTMAPKRSAPKAKKVRLASRPCLLGKSQARPKIGTETGPEWH